MLSANLLKISDGSYNLLLVRFFMEMHFIETSIYFFSDCGAFLWPLVWWRKNIENWKIIQNVCGRKTSLRSSHFIFQYSVRKKIYHFGFLYLYFYMICHVFSHSSRSILQRKSYLPQNKFSLFSQSARLTQYIIWSSLPVCPSVCLLAK